MPLTENFISQLRAAVAEIIEKIVPEKLDDFGAIATIFASLIIPNFNQSLNSKLTEKFKEEITELSGLINSKKETLAFYGVDSEDKDTCKTIANLVTTLINRKIEILNRLSKNEQEQKLTEIQNENQRQLQMRAELSKQAEKIKQSGIIAPGNEGRTLGLNEEEWVQYLRGSYLFFDSDAYPELIYTFFQNNRLLRYEVNGFSEYQQQLIFDYQDRGLHAKHFFEPALRGIDNYQSWHKYGATLVKVLLDNPELSADDIAPRVAKLSPNHWEVILRGNKLEEIENLNQWQIMALLNFPELAAEDFNDSNADNHASLYQALEFLISSKKYEPKAAVTMLKNTKMVQAALLVQYDLDPESINDLDNFQCMLFCDLVENKIMEKSIALQKIVSGLYTLKHQQAFTYLTQEKMLNTEAAQNMLQDLTEQQAFDITLGHFPEEYLSLDWEEIKILLLLKKYGLTRDHLFRIDDWSHLYGFHHRKLLEIWLSESLNPTEELNDIVAHLKEYTNAQAGAIIAGIDINYIKQLTPEQIQSLFTIIRYKESIKLADDDIQSITKMYANKDLWSQGFSYIHGDTIYKLIADKKLSAEDAITTVSNLNKHQAQGIEYGLSRELVSSYSWFNSKAHIKGLMKLLQDTSHTIDECFELRLKESLSDLLVAKIKKIQAKLTKINNHNYSEDQSNIVNQLQNTLDSLMKEIKPEYLHNIERQGDYYNTLKKISSALKSTIKELNIAPQSEHTPSLPDPRG